MAEIKTMDRLEFERDPLPAEQDAQVERVVLAFLLDEHPTQLTIPEVARALNAGVDFAAGDAVERAIRDLDGAGLLHCEGGFAVPTRAALRCAHLWDAC